MTRAGGVDRPRRECLACAPGRALRRHGKRRSGAARRGTRQRAGWSMSAARVRVDPGRRYTTQRHSARRASGQRGGSMNATATAPAPQHMRALAQANRVRLARAELKRQVAEGETDRRGDRARLPVGGREHGDRRPAHEPAPLGPHALPAVPRRRSRMSETKTIGSMTDRQRRALAARLRATSATATRSRSPAGATASAMAGPPAAPPVPADRPDRRRAARLYADGPPAVKPGPRVAISTMWPSGSRR